MIRVNIQLPMAKRRIKTLSSVSSATGISRTTLSHLHTEKATGIQFCTLDALCTFFQCSVGELLEWIPENQNAKQLV